jgi:tRNA modification GTPase
VRGTEHAIITRSRHHDALLRARCSLELAREAAQAGRDHELVAMDLHAALAALGELTGAVTADDILARIFDGFCIGK